MKRIAFLFLVFTCSLVYNSLYAQTKEIPAGSLGLVPLPLDVKAYAANYTLPAKVLIAAKTKDELNTAGFLKAYLNEIGKAVTITTDATTAHIKLKTSTAGETKNPE
ncbi:MAG: hypothetical protein COW65_19390, partial [Cytophagales bacterium CG18_big_fil_WC_8_21_14_2_50_42_9]